MDRNSDDSQMNDDSSDTNMPMSNHSDAKDLKTPGKQEASFSTNGSLNGIERESLGRPDIASKQKSFNANAKKTIKRVRQR